ncbi:HET-domain-containing protein [Agrocybe pediades]|nr:HET-domain-containing protein [Agrocybe pediades]
MFTAGLVWTPGPLYFTCEVCKNGPFNYENFRSAIVKKDEDYRTNYTYTTTWGDIYYGMKYEKCNFCRLLRRARECLPPIWFYEDDPYRKVTVGLRIIIPAHKEESDVTDRLELQLDDHHAAEYAIYAVEGNIASKEIGLGRHFRNSPSYVDFEKVKQRIDNCSTNHDTCPTIKETTLPTRVIDCANPARPLLVETHRKTKGHYTTLSYTWGEDQKQKLTERNIGTYLREGLPIDLPQTISDAITATHNLGIRWLWVDAFCIIQDSDEDKLLELGDMARIYLESYITLSLLSSFRASQGFLPDSGDQPFLPFHVSHDMNPQGELGTMNMRYCIPPIIIHGTFDPPEPLEQRAWCFQETILSPRILVFHPPKAMYICRGYEEDITRPENDGLEAGPQRIPITNLFNDQKQREAAARNDKALRELWGSLLERYSSRDMTEPTDKLVAFSSVAEVYQSLTKDEYLAGLWRRHLIDELLWKSRFMKPRPTVYRAPTWSWAAIDGGVRAYKPAAEEIQSMEYEATVVACTVVPKSHLHPLGEIKEATLQLKAKCVPLLFNGRKCRFIERLFPSGVSGANEEFSQSTWVPPNGNCLQKPHVSKIQGLLFDSKEGSSQSRYMDFHVLVLRAGSKRREHAFMAGLLLLKEDPTKETYRRVSMIRLDFLPDWVQKAPLKTITIL